MEHHITSKILYVYGLTEQKYSFHKIHEEVVEFQIILSTILAIQNSNHAQEHKYLREKSFLLKGKNHRTNSE